MLEQYVTVAAAGAGRTPGRTSAPKVHQFGRGQMQLPRESVRIRERLPNGTRTGRAGAATDTPTRDPFPLERATLCPPVLRSKHCHGSWAAMCQNG